MQLKLLGDLARVYMRLIQFRFYKACNYVKSKRLKCLQGVHTRL